MNLSYPIFTVAGLEGPEFLIPLSAVILLFGIPIVRMLTEHQRKMTELFHGVQKNQSVDTNVAQELAHLRAQNQQILSELAATRDQLNQILLSQDSSAPIIRDDLEIR